MGLRSPQHNPAAAPRIVCRLAFAGSCCCQPNFFLGLGRILTIRIHYTETASGSAQNDCPKMHSVISPDSSAVIKLPSGATKVITITPNT